MHLGRFMLRIALNIFHFIFYNDFYFFHYSWFTMFSQFSTVQVDPVAYISIHSFYISDSTWFPVLYSKISLVVHSQDNTLHLFTPSSQSTHSITLPLGNHKSILHFHDFLFCGKVHLCHILNSSYK